MTLTYHCLPFDQLSTHDLYNILRLRQEIFIVEQNCPYLDADGKDVDAFHILIKNEEDLIAYTRLLPKGISYEDYASIGRVVNKKGNRGHGLGKKLMEYSIEKTKEHYPNSDIKISAQTYLNDFYGNLGFVKIGDSYLEDDIPHQAMILKVS
ncbi:MAG: GNAT family N-acetyltransferase [Saprospiraceae bacterium]|nr:GNAT family N-acetyltransferase [Bacteroidia bacterium]NNE14078.1 GNAT family N-acetyltransferase [Saprospiraceae bacterium]NNL92294.1 GNAT family N-acetyltransferase [Saprospiraceae bacterium]